VALLSKAQLMTQISNQEIEKTLRNSECLISSIEVAAAYERLAAQLNLHYVGLNPIVMVVMNGGLIPAGQLLTHLTFYHRMHYIHASRYRDNEGTSELDWKFKPDVSIEGEHVLLIDDIFDEGITLKAIVEELGKEKPLSIESCVLLNKQHDRKVAGFDVDFVGIDVADRYVYGCGMDFHGYLRHLPGIYAIKEGKI
jgi:hypoxanthine phosphoribosyltransferase